jgi:HK97 family phage portal protein
MRVLGLEIQRIKKDVRSTLYPVDSRSGWFPIIREPWGGAWQSNVEITLTNVLTHPTVFACISLISSDIAKLCLRLVQQDDDGIWTETENPAYSPVLRTPNPHQTRLAFIKSWVISKLAYGNTYVLKQRDNRRVVTAMYVLDPSRVTVLQAPDRTVYYQLKRDNFAGLGEDEVAVPASEIIHDVMEGFYHPLVGLSPIYACGLAATLGLKIQTNSANFFSNGSNPGGILMAPGAISQETADRLKEYWEDNFAGDNVGKVAVLGDDLKYQAMTISADKSQLTEQWAETAKAIAACFHVPAYLVGAAPPPAYNNIEGLTLAYYSQCLQVLIEAIEALLDKGLGLGADFGNRYGTEFDIADLLRMDSRTMMSTLAEGVQSGLVSPNEGRKKLNLGPVDGGDTPYLQQQNFSLAALDERDEQAPLALPPAPEPAPAVPDAAEDDDSESESRFAAALLRKVATLDYAA